LAPRKPFLLRIRPELWEELSRWAADDLRSVNAHIEYLLREAVRRRRGMQREEPGEAGAPRDEREESED
jgi:hypothetical protein